MLVIGLARGLFAVFGIAAARGFLRLFGLILCRPTRLCFGQISHGRFRRTLFDNAGGLGRDIGRFVRISGFIGIGRLGRIGRLFGIGWLFTRHTRGAGGVFAFWLGRTRGTFSAIGPHGRGGARLVQIGGGVGKFGHRQIAVNLGDGFKAARKGRQDLHIGAVGLHADSTNAVFGDASGVTDFGQQPARFGAVLVAHGQFEPN